MKDTQGTQTTVQNINEIKEVINHAEQKEFSKFADKVKTSLEDKLRNNDKIKSAGQELLKLQAMKTNFAKVSDAGDTASSDNTPSTPSEPSEPTE